jgi:hypothetical protein
VLDILNTGMRAARERELKRRSMRSELHWGCSC